ncbi:MAG TPA: 2-oxoglutarate and iron-dependent oxygenase domain-containing protein [Novosphingobium sp.]
MQAEGTRFTGLWQRLLISQPGLPVDTLTQVGWLQGPGLYVDLRQPPAIAGKVQASCLAELLPEEARLLAAQEGFAGSFHLVGDEAEWARAIDFQPAGLLGDRGRLEDHGDLLIEHGIEAVYIEHWQREPETKGAPCWAAQLLSEDDRLVMLVRCGDRFGYARERALSLRPGECLLDRVSQASAVEARELVDCEIALGTVSAEGWRIDRSTLPWREGALLLRPCTELIGGRLTMADMDAQGLPIARRLSLVQLEGEPDFAQAARPQVTAGAPSAIPVVDIAALGGADPVAEAAAVEALRRAAGEVGFLHITGHGIAPAVTERLQAAANAFFAQPEAIKMASYIGRSTNHRGYVPEGEEVFATGKRDRKEAFDLALDLPAGEVPAGHPMLGPNQWPDLPSFREDIMAYYAAAFAVGRRLLRGFAQALGRPADSFDHLVGTPPSQLRLVHYPYDAEASDAPGIGAHTDYECFTLLLATGPGLEVMDQAGEWVDVPPVPGGLIVNIGDMMEFWSGSAFVATSHRVRKVAEERYSFPLFFALDYDVELMPLGRNAAPIRTGEHLYAQTVQTFRYLKDRAERGEIALPDTSRPLSSFGQEARHSHA